MAKKLTPDQLRRRAERSAREATFPKCPCGNVLGLTRLQADIKHCRGCLPDERMGWTNQMKMAIHQVEDPAARVVLSQLLRQVDPIRRYRGRLRHV